MFRNKRQETSPKETWNLSSQLFSTVSNSNFDFLILFSEISKGENICLFARRENTEGATRDRGSDAHRTPPGHPRMGIRSSTSTLIPWIPHS